MKTTCGLPYWGTEGRLRASYRSDQEPEQPVVVVPERVPQERVTMSFNSLLRERSTPQAQRFLTWALYAIVLVLPGSFVVLPLLAWWQYRRDKIKAEPIAVVNIRQ